MEIHIRQPHYIYEQGKRQRQEDSLFPEPGAAHSSSRVFLVCDGLGGYDNGKLASSIVAQAMGQALEDCLGQQRAIAEEQLIDALEKAYEALEATEEGKHSKMGTTMTCICLHQGGCLAAHIGDSRIYHLRTDRPEVRYRSRDDSIVQLLYETGELSYYGMRTSPRRNIMTKVIQPTRPPRMPPTVALITDIRPGDYFYLCSDGMLEKMDDDELLSILADDTTDEQKLEELRSRTQYNSDNHSAYLIAVDSVVGEPGDQLLDSNEEKMRQENKALNDQQKDIAWTDSIWDDDDEPEEKEEAPQSAASLKNWAKRLLSKLPTI